MPRQTARLYRFKLAALFALCLLFAAAPFSQASAQRRDSLSDMEAELVREAQEIDRRTEVFIKAVDRRFLVINRDNSQAKQIAKDIDLWGELPAGTPLQLFTDIKKILQSAIDNIDDVAAHDRMDTKLFPKAVRKLAEAAQRYLPQLKTALNTAADEREKGAILSAVESCEQIIEASAKVPKEEAVKGKKKKDDN